MKNIKKNKRNKAKEKIEYIESLSGQTLEKIKV
jgi:hypothetical protein